MKKMTFIIMAALLAVATMTGCKSTGKQSLLGSVKQVIVGDDYEAAGRAVGEASYTARLILAGNPKYDKYISKYDEFCQALDNAESETVKLGTINQVALEVMQVALTAKYGYAKASLITTGVRIGGAVADRIIAKKVDTVAADQFIKGFKEGLDAARETTPAESIVVADNAAKKPFECPEGNCDITVTNKKVSHQLAIAKELRDGGYLDENEQPASEYACTKYKNVIDFISRCDVLKKFNVKKTQLYITKFSVKGGKLSSIEFKMLMDDGSTLDVDCVACMTVPEIDDLID